MTAQVSNRIFVYGALRDLLSRPETKFLDQLEKKPAFCARSTANWSGYTTSWEIREGKLYFTALEGTVCKRAPDDDAEPKSGCAIKHDGQCDVAGITLAHICDVPFGGIHAIWFSGELRILEGELVEYVHAGWASGYERDLIVGIVSGEVVDEKIVRVPADTPSPSQSLWRRILRQF